MLWTKAWWKGAGERSLKTFVEVWVAVFGVRAGAAALDLEGAAQLPWETATVTAGIATLLAFAIAIGNANFTAGGIQTRPDIAPPEQRLPSGDAHSGLPH